MSLDDAFRAGYRSLLARPAAVLPFYVAGLATTAVARTVPFVGILVAYLSIAGTGRLDRLEALFEDAAPISVDDPDSLVGIDQDALLRAIEDVLTTELQIVLAVSLLLAVLVVLVVDAILSAGQLHAVYATIRGRPPTRHAVAGTGRHWRTFVGLVVAELLVYAAAVAVVGVATQVATAGAGTVAVVAALVGLVGTFALLPLFVAVRLGFAFARPAAVVDDVGLGGAVRGGFGHLRSSPLGSVGYGVLAIVAIVVASTVGSGLGILGSAAGGTLLVALLAFPVLDVTKTVLYADRVGASLSVPQVPEVSTRTRLRRGLRAGLRELASFTRDAPLALVASTAVFAGGLLLGLRIGGAIDHVFVASIERRLEQFGPVSALFTYAPNNWSVAAAQAFSGFAFGIPTLLSLVINGANVGVLYELEADPTLLVAFIVPHGILEIPALLLSGALGIHLGGLSVRYVLGSADRSAVAAAVDRAYWIAVGLAVPFGVAALIEAFVSPYYWQFLGI